ncbi:MAG: hypothetical protein M1338_05340 [Patescibacteria group bacterium]|nr:hypothetical protein [Patescibacteria group bacterium]
MNNEELNQELIKVKKLIPEIEQNTDKRVKNLRGPIRKSLLNIKVIPNITSSGLESCETILKYLYWAEYLIEKEITKRVGFFDEKKLIESKNTEIATKQKMKNIEPEKFPFQHSSLNPHRTLPSSIKPESEAPRKIGFMQKMIFGLPTNKKNNVIKNENELTIKNDLPIKPVTKNLYKKIKITPTEPKTIDFGPFYDKNKEEEQ